MMRHTPLFEKQRALGAKFTEFYGWEMPLEYSGTIGEHEAVRRSAGLFDVSNMGIIEVGGADSAGFLASMLPFRPDSLPVNSLRYSFLLNGRGGIKDDLMAFRLNDDRFILVVNSSNAASDLAWLKENVKGFSTVLIDDSPDTAILALQGPASPDIIREAFGTDPASFKHHQFITAAFDGRGVLIAKAGYTGEKGFEIYIHRQEVEKAWDAIMAAGAMFAIVPCGLGARDTLRLEMGYLLHGNDADEDTDPISAGYVSAIDFDNEAFIGREALLRIREAGPSKKLTGLVLTGHGIPRQGCKVYSGEAEAGIVTSGNFSPMLRKGIALGYVKAGLDGPFSIDIRGRRVPAEAVGLPFYKKPRG